MTPSELAVLLPKGPRGLWCALAAATAPLVVDRALPASDLATLGAGASMFDYDVAAAIDLGMSLDELLGGLTEP